MIFDGQTDENGLITIYDSVIQTGNTDQQETMTFMKTPLTIIVKKGNLSNVTKTRNKFNNNISYDHTIMLDDNNEWDHISINKMSIEMPSGLKAVYSQGENLIGMTFCAHIYHDNNNSILFQVNSTNTTTNENELNDSFYDVMIFNETGSQVGAQIWTGYGAVSIESISVPIGHYDITWKYYNSGNTSELIMESNSNKFIYLSLDAKDLNINYLDLPKSGSYSVNIEFVWDEPRDIFLRGYTTSITNDYADRSHISNLIALNNTTINTNTNDGYPMYSNSIFGYYLGNYSSSQLVTFDMVTLSLNNEINYSQDTFLFRLNDNGWKYSNYNDLDYDGISDSSENGQTEEGDAGDRADLDLQRPYVYIGEGTEYSHAYQGWKNGINQNGYTIYWSQSYCVVRRDITLYIWLPNSIQYTAMKIIFPIPIDSFNWLNCLEASKPKGKEKESYQINLNIKPNAPIVYFYIKFYTMTGSELSSYITVYVILDIEILNYLSTMWGDYKNDLPKYALHSYMYDQWNPTPYPYSETIIYNYANTINPNYHYEKKYILNPTEKIIYHNAVRICYGSTDINSAIIKIGTFTENIMYYSAPYFDGTSDYKLANICTATITDNKIDQALKSEQSYINGQCLDYASMVCGFARAIGIPARDVYGLYCHNWRYHVWTEYWTGTDWAVYDACDVDLSHTYSNIPSQDIDWDKNINAVAIKKSTRQNYKFGVDVPINSYNSEGIYLGSPNWCSDNNYIIGNNNENYDEKISPNTYDIISMWVEYH